MIKCITLYRPYSKILVFEKKIKEKKDREKGEKEGRREENEPIGTLETLRISCINPLPLSLIQLHIFFIVTLRVFILNFILSTIRMHFFLSDFYFSFYNFSLFL